MEIHSPPHLLAGFVEHPVISPVEESLALPSGELLLDTYAIVKHYRSSISPNIKVSCYTCDQLVYGGNIFNHLFFGHLQCLYCKIKIVSCELLCNTSRNDQCVKSSTNKHVFQKWVSNTMDYLIYYIHKDLVIQRFCSKGNGNAAPFVIWREIAKYVDKLHFLEFLHPWHAAIRACWKVINEKLQDNSQVSSNQATASVNCYDPIQTEDPRNEDSFITHVKQVSLCKKDTTSNVQTGVFSTSNTNKFWSETLNSGAGDGIAEVSNFVNPENTMNKDNGRRMENTYLETNLSMDSGVKQNTKCRSVGEGESSTVCKKNQVTGVDILEEEGDEPSNKSQSTDLRSFLKEVGKPRLGSNKVLMTSADQEQGSATVLKPSNVSQELNSQPSVQSNSLLAKSITEISSDPAKRNSNLSHVTSSTSISHDESDPDDPGIVSESPPIDQQSTSLDNETAITGTRDATVASVNKVATSHVGLVSITKKTAGKKKNKKRKVLIGMKAKGYYSTKHTTAKPPIPIPDATNLPIPIPDAILKSGNYLIIKFPTQKCPDECPNCYSDFDFSKFNVNCCTYVMNIICSDCKLMVYVVPDIKDGI